jgi:hypothetical protein
MAVIAVSLFAIAVRLWMPGYATMGELQTIVKIGDNDEKQKALASWRARLPMVRIQGGTVDVDVTSMSPTVDVNVTSMP